MFCTFLDYHSTAEFLLIGEACNQLAFFDFCAGNRLQIVAHAWMEVVKLTAKMWIARVEVMKVAQRIGLSPKCGTNCTVVVVVVVYFI